MERRRLTGRPARGSAKPTLAAGGGEVGVSEESGLVPLTRRAPTPTPRERGREIPAATPRAPTPALPRERGREVLWLGALLVLSPALASAQADFDPESNAWNSISELVRIARDRSRVEIPERLDAGTLEPGDALLIVFPDEAPPAAPITAFLRAGGRALLADDFGEGESLLRTYQIERRSPRVEGVTRLRANPALLVARSREGHRLTQGVSAVVTNHPAVLHHRELEPVLELAPGEALVLAGAVGEGRLVVLSDPSVLIDQMLVLGGNRRFAENLVEYLVEGGEGRVFILTPGARIVGRFGEPGADRPLHDLRQALERVAHLELPKGMLSIAAALALALALGLAWTSLPRRSPYRPERMFARAASQGGLVGRVGLFGGGRVDLLGPLVTYRIELEAELVRRLGLESGAPLSEVERALAARGLPRAELAEMRGLLRELGELRDRMDNPRAARVGPRRFQALVARGERLLSSLPLERV